MSRQCLAPIHSHGREIAWESVTCPKAPVVAGACNVLKMASLAFRVEINDERAA
jgi:hypothetical protein